MKNTLETLSFLACLTTAEPCTSSFEHSVRKLSLSCNTVVVQWVDVGRTGETNTGEMLHQLVPGAKVHHFALRQDTDTIEQSEDVGARLVDSQQHDLVACSHQTRQRLDKAVCGETVQASGRLVQQDDCCMRPIKWTMFFKT